MDDLPKLCMFCGKDESYGPMNKEDFVPKGLWEKRSRPPRIKTVPAHESCNKSFSQDNEYFRDVLAMEAGVTDRCEAARKVVEGAIKRKFEHRFGSIVNTIKNLRIQPVQTASGFVFDFQPSFEVDWSRINRVLLNCMKGIYFTIEKTPMPSNFIYRIQDLRHMDLDPYRRLFADMVPWQTFGDDAFMCRYRFLRRPETVGVDCLMRFYQNRCFFGQAVSHEWAKQHIDSSFIPLHSDSAIVFPKWIVHDK